MTRYVGAEKPGFAYAAIYTEARASMERNGYAYGLAASRGFLCAEDVDLIRKTIADLGPEPRVADLGAGSGTTALAIFDERRDARVWTVDISREAIEWAGRALQNAGYIDRWRGVVGNARRYWLPEDAGAEPLDAVLHDAGHEYGDVLMDLREWLPHVAPGGAVWVHDYGPTGDAPIPANLYPGVARAIDVLVSEKLVEVVEYGGWGVRLRRAA